ncbi:MAG: MerR family transcriptional regulator [Lachnospiraceae bacterium]|nr:MerR family transcriptional regulator [Lachnospiraceae bacterium]
MTIKDFAKLCGCNPQTLRYYDSINLLKPVNVDSWTGYRYYDETQAIPFVKIRNLQKAGFSIDEIKGLIEQDDLAIAMAFDAKIAEAEAHLREIKTIRQSYLTEMNTIKETIDKMRERITNDIRNYDPATEFGIGEEQYGEFRQQIEECMAQAAESVPNLPDFSEMFGAAGASAPVTQPDFRTDPAFGVIYEKHGWENVRDFLDECSDLEGEYGLDFSVREDKYANAIPFSNTLLMLLLSKNEGRNKKYSCNVEKSADGENHFRLWKRMF